MDGGQVNNIKETATQSVPACECERSVDSCVRETKRASQSELTMQDFFFSPRSKADFVEYANVNSV